MALQIEAGKYYRTRDGRKVGPMQHRPDRLNPDRAWCNGIGTGMCWSHDGEANEEATVAADLIAEWRDDTPAHIVTHEGREYDLTALETPPCLLPNCVVYALQVWPHGVQSCFEGRWSESKRRPTSTSSFVYRAKPAPESPWFIPQDGATYDRVEVKNIGGVLHIREVKQ